MQATFYRLPGETNMSTAESLAADLKPKFQRLERIEVAPWSEPADPVYRVLARVAGVVREVYTGSEAQVRAYFDLPPDRRFEHPKANENDLAGCVECGEPLPYGGHVATPLCDACLSRPVPRDGSIGSFPQEPVFGSPEAVDQAAETIRSWPGATPRENYLESETDRLGQDIDRLKRCLEEADAERDRLRAKVEQLQNQLERDAVAARENLSATVAEAEEQRDALADALVKAKTALRLAAEAREADIRDEADEALAVVNEALRKAGR